MKNLIYVHVGIGTLPEYILDSLFQVLLVNVAPIKIHVLLNDSEIPRFVNLLKDIDWKLYDLSPDTSIITSSIDTLNVEKIITRNSSVANFRDGFWLHTTSRFLIIEKYMMVNNLSLVFHIENDVMMFKSFDFIYKQNQNKSNNNNIWVVKDSPNRVIPSIVFFPNTKSAKDLVKYIRDTRSRNIEFINDMQLLGRYQNVYELPTIPTSGTTICIYDGAAIGQFLGGIDPRNEGKTSFNNYSDSMEVYNKTKGFVNETSDIDPSVYKYITKRVSTGVNYINIPLIKTNEKVVALANLHIHSKLLAMFSSVSHITKESEIISGDRVLSLCDIVFTTRDKYQFHRDSGFREDRFVIVIDFENIKLNVLKKICKTFSRKIKVFVYGEHLALFQRYILPLLEEICIPDSKNIILYIGNSDESFDDRYNTILNSSVVSLVYAQNLNIVSEKCTLLPIGIANRMWVHGDIHALYKVMLNTYNKIKPGAMYLNINPSTFGYRQQVLDTCILKGFVPACPKPYISYLNELVTYKFCMCTRGNGIDTHRFWEALYLGVVPVIINNNMTNCSRFIENIKNLGVPFYEVTSLDQLHPRYFTFELYKSIIGDGTNNYAALSLDRYRV